MYEKPNLTLVGDAQEVILGIMPAGADLDTTYMDSQDEFAVDPDDLNRA